MINNPEDDKKNDMGNSIDNDDYIEDNNDLDVDSHMNDDIGDDGDFNFDDELDQDFDDDIEGPFSNDPAFPEDNQSKSSINWFNIVIFGGVAVAVIGVSAIYLPQILGGGSPTPTTLNQQAQNDYEQNAPAATNKQLAEEAVTTGVSEEIMQSGGLLNNLERLEDGYDKQSVEQANRNRDERLFDNLSDTESSQATNTSQSNAYTNDGERDWDPLASIPGGAESTPKQDVNRQPAEDTQAENTPATTPLPSPSDFLNNRRNRNNESASRDEVIMTESPQPSDIDMVETETNMENDEEPILAQPTLEEEPSANEEDVSQQVETLSNQLEQRDARIEEMQSTIDQLQQRIAALARANVGPAEEETTTVADENETEGDEEPILSQPDPIDEPQTEETAQDMQEEEAQPVATVTATSPEPVAAPTPQPAPNWELRGASPGEAYIANAENGSVRTVVEGDTVNGLGRITSIAVENNRWVVRGTSGSVEQ